MSLITSARSFVRRVRHDGVRCIPDMVYTRLMTLIHRDVLERENAARRAEEAAYQTWRRRHERPDPAPFHTDRRLSFLIPAYNTRPEHLRALADSLLAQSCHRWEACIYDGASPDARTREALAELAARDARFRVVMGEENDGISGNTNRAYAIAAGDVIALCDHDDLLAPDAVRCILEAAEGGADFIYTDEDKVSEDGTRFFESHLKADYAPDALRAGNYVCHITAMTRDLAEELIRADGALLRSAFDGSQDHDLALRACERARKIVHIPRILYHWRMLDASFSHQKAEKCVQAACHAVQEQLHRTGLEGRVGMETLRVRIRYAVPEGAVTAIVMGEGRIPPLPGEVIRVGSPEERNEAARRAKGEYLLFLHSGMTPLDRQTKENWLDEMLMYARRPDVGCVGSAILDAKRFYRHAGYAVDVPGGAVSHHAGQWLYGRPYMITDRLVRNVTGVSGGLLLIRRELFLRLGGFGDYAGDLAGADLGLKCLGAGLVNVYTPHARMVCRGTLPCLNGETPREDLQRFRSAWGEHPQERYYSPLFTRDGRMTIDMTEQEAEE
ncbi:MAG: glycosyltransferase [Clostridiales bacterium]|nr:glycosyltransferase [Clostridiales bacterium]